MHAGVAYIFKDLSARAHASYFATYWLQVLRRVFLVLEDGGVKTGVGGGNFVGARATKDQAEEARKLLGGVGGADGSGRESVEMEGVGGGGGGCKSSGEEVVEGVGSGGYEGAVGAGDVVEVGGRGWKIGGLGVISGGPWAEGFLVGGNEVDAGGS